MGPGWLGHGSLEWAMSMLHPIPQIIFYHLVSLTPLGSEVLLLL